MSANSISVTDSAAFRSIFATTDEKLVLALVDRGRTKGLPEVVDSVQGRRRSGERLKLLLFGDSGAILQESGREATADVGFVETWARPLLPAIIGVADEVIAIGAQSEKLLGEFPVSARTGNPGTERQVKTTGRYVLQNDWGIGDELLLGGVAREILRAHPTVDLWIRSRFGFKFPAYVRRDAVAEDARAIEVIYQNPTLYGPSAHSPYPGHLVQQMLDKFALDTGLKTRAVDVRPELDVKVTGTRLDRSVILHTRTNPRLPSKDWGLDRWRGLAELLRADGVRLRQVGGKEEPRIEGAEDLRGVPAKDLAELFAKSAAVVCVVGFLMHLAAATRTRCVVIYGGREHPAIDGYPDQVHLCSEPLNCRGRWGCHLGPDLDCPHGMKCMDSLTPERVFGAVLQELSKGGRS